MSETSLQSLRCETKRSIRVEYSLPAKLCLRRLRVLPPHSRGGQTIGSEAWNCDPRPDEAFEETDDFGNRVLVLRHERIARELRFEMEVVTQLSTPRVAREANLPPSGIGAFLSASALCDWTEEIRKVASELCEESTQSPRQLAQRACQWAHEQIEYSPGTTTVTTSASQSLQCNRGVCQDQAHLFIALCRAMKLPARYVSGYLPGEGAAHAWAEVLIGQEWIGFDPTHNRKARSDYVFVATGRDFRDCPSIEGSYRGNATAKLESRCVTRVLER